MCDHPQGYIKTRKEDYCPQCLVTRPYDVGWICECQVCPLDCDFTFLKERSAAKSIAKDKTHYPTFKEWIDMQHNLRVERLEKALLTKQTTLA